ncbi:MAG: glycosyltransferase [Brevundimonas sp.]|uniref:glycosyltransferase family 4 protein n=1 Tax=Brevundimonas sp. TaxID=1871086 RepID=UPI00258F462A|nr:glycosyltransferase [Brevundimonas sp.]MCV0414752.1 glycosyltransferase [Brevundimonas sp.]
MDSPTKAQSVGKIYVVVQGLFEVSDSIGFDAYYHYKVLQGRSDRKFDVYLVAEKFREDLYPGAEIRSFDWFTEQSLSAKDIVVYHYCDGWSDAEDHLLATDARLICRWHNNTPPWFYAKQDARSTQRTIKGFQRIRQLVESGKFSFAVNSSFTSNQLIALGHRGKTSIIYPASRYLTLNKTSKAYSRREDAPLKLLFVSRVVAHKGHKHVIAAAEFITRVHGVAVEVHFAGRHNGSASDYDLYLRDLSDRLEVSTQFHGELSDDELVSLYDSSDVFCCFSEHEGFGLPVFEAYSRGLPVVSWGRCATAEFTQNNPLSVREFSISRFSAAILAAAEAENQGLIVEMQNHLGSVYRPDVVARQLHEAVGIIDDFAGSSREAEAGMVDYAVLRAAVDKYDAMHEGHHAVEEAHEFGENFVTLYDLESYEALLFSMDRYKGEGATIAAGATDRLEVSARQFSTHYGLRSGEDILIAGRHDGYDVFGPYMAFPPGHYRVEFLLSTELIAIGGGGRILADVHSENRGVIAESVYTSAPGVPLRAALSFLVVERGDILEFRLKALSAGTGSLSFKGVVIRRLADPSELVVNRKSRLRPGPGHIIGRRWNRFALKIGLLKSAPDPFKAADALRDSRRWLEAGEEYARVLECSKASYAHQVQAGHCFKEAGEFERSLECYQAAIALDDRDPDLLLNIGHLYKRMGDARMAEKFYAYAVSTHPAIAHALRELARCGVSIDQAQDLADALA